MKFNIARFLLLPKWAYCIVLFALMLLYMPLQAQKQYHILDDAKRLTLVKQCIGYMYNWQFDEAESTIAVFSKGIENHPVVPFAQAMIIYWKIMPIDFSDTKSYPKHLDLLEKASSLADAMLDIDPEDSEGQFFKMASRSLIMKHLADAGQPMKAVSEARGVYKLIKNGFELKEKNPEFYFTTGIYNYYREYYPERHPVYKPVAFFFQSGDKTLGLEQLVYGARNAIFTSVECYIYLSQIYLRFEQNNEKAIVFAKELLNKYPKNFYFLGSYAEILSLTNQYQKAAPYISQLQQHHDPYYKALGELFTAMRALSQQQIPKAKEHYLIVEKITDPMPHRFGMQKTYLYYGLSKVYATEKNTEKARLYYQKAKDHDINHYLDTVTKPDF